MFTLAIVGRPNVGKSTLFNRLAGKKLAIVDDTPGVTRDWREAEGHLFDRTFRVLDTAGLEESFDDSIPGRMRAQTEHALKQADAILFLIDGRAGLTPLDEHFASWLRKQKKPIILGVNKCENDKASQAGAAEAYRLGFGEPITMSAEHNIGMDEIYHALTPYFPEAVLTQEEEDEEFFRRLAAEELDAIEGDENFAFDEGIVETPKPIKLAIVGRPNVGKSTLMNALLNDERVMTGPEAGITRDAITVPWSYDGTEYRLVDTAGLRHKAKVMNKIEKMSADDTMRVIRLAQIVIFVVDANAAFEKQDLRIAHHIIEEGRALVIAVNKWDAAEDKIEIMAQLEHDLKHSLSQVRQVPVVTMSAIRGKGLDKLMETVKSTYDMWNKRVPTGQLNRWLAGMESHHPAPLVAGRPNRLKYITQIKARPPTFGLWVSRPDDLPDTYKNYLVNGLRERFEVPGVPIRFTVRASKNPYTS
ncbi:MAG: ribosome biogenesis GTPase Der [Alphaproteobacteria bacterium]|nr:ribosome biogenesis GTPase Der [Alphaproteobacteria bacterium]